MPEAIAIVEPSPDTPLVWFDIAIRGGASEDPSGLEGLHRHTALLAQHRNNSGGRDLLDHGAGPIDRTGSVSLIPWVEADPATLGPEAPVDAVLESAPIAHDEEWFWEGNVQAAVVGHLVAEGWRIRVTDDHRSEVTAPGQWVTLQGGGLATSSTTVRRWATDVGSAHHLLDPATGRPATGPWRTVSVTAASCLDANIASTAAIVRGERAPAWLESQRLPSRLVRVEGGVLRIGEFRVFYDVNEAEARVMVRAIRHKPPHKTTEEIL